MHGYKWPINCTRTRTVIQRQAAGGGEGDEHRLGIATVALLLLRLRVLLAGPETDARVRVQLIGHL